MCLDNTETTARREYESTRWLPTKEESDHATEDFGLLKFLPALTFHMKIGITAPRVICPVSGDTPTISTRLQLLPTRGPIAARGTPYWA